MTLEQEITKKDKKIEELKRESKAALLEEYKIRLDTAEEESLRLRNIIKTLSNSSENQGDINKKLANQNKELKTLKRQNNELLLALGAKTNENAILLSKLKQEELNRSYYTTVEPRHNLNLSKSDVHDLNEVAPLIFDNDTIIKESTKKFQPSNDNAIGSVSKSNSKVLEKNDLYEEEKLPNVLPEATTKARVIDNSSLNTKELFNKPIILRPHNIKFLNTMEVRPSNMKKIVSDKEVYPIKVEIRARLLLNQKNKEVFIEEVFRNYNDSIEVSQLAKELLLIGLAEDKSQIFSRFVIEPRDNLEIQYFADYTEKVPKVKNIFENSLEIPYCFSSINDIDDVKEQALLKSKENILHIEEDEVTLMKWEEIFKEIDLNEIENDILISLAFENSQDINRLSINVNMNLSIVFA